MNTLTTVKRIFSAMQKSIVIFNILLLGGVFADSPHAINYWQEVSIWPEDSKVLVDGIKKIEETKDPGQDPALVITRPTFLLYLPKKHSSQSAVVVFPGGGYKVVAVGKDSTLGPDGADVCRWLTDAGVVCVLLKYRVPNTGCHWDQKTRQNVTPEIPMALQDAQRTISMIRYNAKKYGVYPHKIGVLGFSAGGNMAVLSSAAFKWRSYDTLDAIDQVSSRPDFVIAVYPGHMTMEHKNKSPIEIAANELNTDIKISKDMPPTLLVHAKDDPVDSVHYSEVYERELRKLGVKVKLNLYNNGGHAFGVKKQGKDTDRWMADALEWLKEIKML